MKRNGFIKVTLFDETVKPTERVPIGTALVDVEEIIMIACNEMGSVIYTTDATLKIFVFESEKELQMKINAAKSWQS